MKDAVSDWRVGFYSPKVKGIVDMVNFLKSGRSSLGVNILFLVIVLGLFLASPSGRAGNGYDPSTEARCSWDAPTYGTPVDHYILQVADVTFDEPATETYDNILDEYFDVPVEFFHTYKARVAGVDSLGRQGPWSLWTPLYNPDAVPDEEK